MTEQIFKRGSKEHYEEYVKSMEYSSDRILTYEEFIESLEGDES